MTTNVKKIKSIWTEEEKQRIREACANNARIFKLKETDEGVEIIDFRPLKEKIYNPLKGKGILFHFSDNYIVTKDCFEKLVSVYG